MARAKKARPASRRPAPSASRPAPSERPLSRRLFLRPDSVLVALDAPPGYRRKLGPLPRGTRVEARLTPGAGTVHLFAPDADALRRSLSRLGPEVGRSTALWVSYAKTTSPLSRDLSRERVWEVARPFGLRPVAQVSVDADWSALRFKRG